MRIILFDIDGTLILTGRAGQFAMHQVADMPGDPPEEGTAVSFAGRTDRAIITDYFRLAGLDDTEANFQAFCQEFYRKLPDELEQRQGSVLPGVASMLDALASAPDISLGLLTGNLRRTAWMKLRHYGLDHYFYRDGGVMGAFGDLHHDRDDVARSALRSVRDWHGHRRLDAVWVVGDTPLDIQCARAIDAGVLAVATGNFTKGQLQAAGADVVVSDLTSATGWLASQLAGTAAQPGNSP